MPLAMIVPEFTAAARAVHRTQSAVSMQMKRLEARVGHRLFARGARGVVPTAEGEALLGTARRVLRLLEAAAQDLRAPQLQGSVRIGLPEEYGATVLPRLLSDFAAAHPKVMVSVHCGLSAALDEALARGDRVELRGFGAFSVRHREARIGRNPRTGAAVEVDEKHIPFFKTGKLLRDRLNTPA